MTANNYSQYCAFRLPCGICTRTNSYCPLPSGTIAVTWTTESTSVTINPVEVIRCKDCAEWRLARDGEGECYDGMADGAMTHETDFCSWARRRTDD